jgi:sugar lactone lactonase YvrE
MTEIGTDIDVEAVLQAHAKVAEGPTWDARTNTLVWVDIMANAVHVFDPATGQDRAVDVGQPVGAAGLREGGGLVLALRDGLGLLGPQLNDLRMIAPVEADNPKNRFNDGKCDAAGRFWAGTMGFQPSPGTGTLYRLDFVDSDFRVTRALADVTLSNGLDWTADNRTMYYVDSPTQGIDAFDFDLSSGSLTNRRRLISVPAAEGLPDGMTVDADGGIWLALHGSGTVRRYLPSGEVDRVIRLPGAKLITSCAFGGADLGDLYITSMTYGFSAQELADQPNAGSIFRCRPGVKGRLPHRFAG